MAAALGLGKQRRHVDLRRRHRPITAATAAGPFLREQRRHPDAAVDMRHLHAVDEALREAE